MPPVPTPAEVQPETISAGDFHTCGLKGDGTVACWVKNANGQATLPVGAFTQVSTGYTHTCRLKTDGTVACWGWDQYGQITPRHPAFSPRSAPAILTPAG